MFAKLGKFITGHPVVVLVTWLVVVVVASLGALWGFGEGNLFKRMETSEYSIPGSGSEQVAHLTESKDEHGPTSLLVVTGVDVDQNEAEVAEFAKENRDLFEGTYVDSVADAFMISEAQEEAEAEAEEEIQKTIEEETEKALAQVLEEAEASKAEAQAQIEAGVAEAAAMGPQAEAMARAQADEALAQVEAETAAAVEQAQAEVAAQVQEEVTAQAEAAANEPDVLKQKEDAEKQKEAMLSDEGGGWAVIVTRDAGLDSEQDAAARTELDEATAKYQEKLSETFPGAEINEMSQEQVEDSIMSIVQKDLVKGEAIGLPVAALLMVIVFGGALAAGMPLVGALSAIAAGMGALWALTFATTVDSFILNVVSIIGVALSIDYGLLVVSRYREEARLIRAAQDDGSRASRSPAGLQSRVVVPAVTTTIQTAGRTVLFSAVTIALSLVGLFLMRVHMLKMIALGGIVVTLLAVLAAATLVPALLTLLGRKLLVPSPITKLPGFGKLVSVVGDSTTDHGFFYKLARWDEKRPWLVMLVSAAVLIGMATPLTTLTLRNNFADYIPADEGVGVAYNTLQAEYPTLATPDVQAVVDAPETSAAVIDLVEATGALPDVSDVWVEPLEADEEMTVVTVLVDADDAVGPEVTNVVYEMRDMDVGADVWVGGSAAIQHDFSHALGQDAGKAVAVVLVAVLVLLFLMTGSLVVPVRALIINTLSLAASLGVTTAIFNNGWIGVPKTNGLETFIVAVMIAFGFGLAMDYEVFLLARIKEYWDEGKDNDTAVAMGLQRSGRIITSAAAIIVAVFVGFALGDMIAIKQIGVALAVMVITDATITRLFLVPSVMTILGKWNWWAPKPLAKLADKIGLRE